MTLTFDTLEATRKLRDGGHTEAQAEAVVEVIQDAHDELVTRDGFRAEMAELRTEMAELRTELRGEMAELRTELRGEMAELRTELRGEMAEFREEVRTEIAELRGEMTAQIAALRAELYRAFWVFGTGLVASMGVIVTVVNVID